MSSTTGAEHADEPKRPRLDGRSAVVTGASRGIGLAVATALLERGARVALVARSEQVLRDVANRFGARAMPVVCDVSDNAAVVAVTDRIADTLAGAPDILLNNAGSFEPAAVERTDPAAFLQAIETNLIAPFLFARAFLPAMRARGRGHIVTIGSVADRAVFSENGAYAASKHGVRALHEVMRLELRGTGVRTTLVSPGPVDTPLWDDIDPDDRPGFTTRADMLGAGAVADAVLFAVTQPQDVNIDELRLSRS